MSKNKLPIFGIGPMYVISCLILTILGLVLDHNGLLNQGKISNIKIFMVITGSIFIIAGIVLWIYAVLIQKISTAIKRGKLMTNGVYSIVRNPIYSAFIIAFTGALLTANNLFLLILPIIFYLSLTLLLKRTEEKWLLEKFGEEYIDYCKKVNRIIPWLRVNRNDTYY